MCEARENKRILFMQGTGCSQKEARQKRCKSNKGETTAGFNNGPSQGVIRASQNGGTQDEAGDGKLLSKNDSHKDKP